MNIENNIIYLYVQHEIEASMTWNECIFLFLHALIRKRVCLADNFFFSSSSDVVDNVLVWEYDEDEWVESFIWSFSFVSLF